MEREWCDVTDGRIDPVSGGVEYVIATWCPANALVAPTPDQRVNSSCWQECVVDLGSKSIVSVLPSQ
ncbi:hypothetical protein JTE90_015485 [Oedothorax gibbosus]|uniref:Uncharacterized protein n=1 Tax=Oedothorax gibbosus TaxID=931172 RepID=A0AAV6VRG8_9ARAC|nr:hypothetical protein JTE90_015485 [Oedothorax gibbosus]